MNRAKLIRIRWMDRPFKGWPAHFRLANASLMFLWRVEIMVRRRRLPNI